MSPLQLHCTRALVPHEYQFKNIWQSVSNTTNSNFRGEISINCTRCQVSSIIHFLCALLVFIKHSSFLIHALIVSFVPIYYCFIYVNNLQSEIIFTFDSNDTCILSGPWSSGRHSNVAYAADVGWLHSNYTAWGLLTSSNTKPKDLSELAG